MALSVAWLAVYYLYDQRTIDLWFRWAPATPRSSCREVLAGTGRLDYNCGFYNDNFQQWWNANGPSFSTFYLWFGVPIALGLSLWAIPWIAAGFRQEYPKRGEGGDA